MWRFACCVAITAALPIALGRPWYVCILLGLLLYIGAGGWKYVKLSWTFITRDIFLFFKIIKIGTLRKDFCKSNKILSDFLSDNAKKYPDKTAYISAETGKSLTFKEANELANKVANYFNKLGYKKGDTIALLMENRIEFVAIWLGLSKLGVVTAFINTNLKADGLLHCLNIVDTKSIIYSSFLSDNLNTVNISDTETFCWDQENNSKESLLSLLLQSSSKEPERQKDINATDKLVYIYTSGTTGLPKAAIVKAQRITAGCLAFNGLCTMQHEDIFYNSLPLYHSSGGILAPVFCLINASTMVIRKKFSASNFFEDCCKFECTIFIYIGELCRYLLAQPQKEFDKTHKIRFAIGNGLRESIWTELQKRFNIPIIREFYAATEGNCGMMNMFGKPGAIGYSPPCFNRMSTIGIIKVDEETGEILRGTNGLAIQCEANEPGQIVGRLVVGDPLEGFDGYKDQKANKKKIACNIFKKGDTVFLSGDILKKDEYGYYYFVDRMGDTFRWKGENVSTNQVEGMISKCVKLNDVCVYGVSVVGNEGKAGMACIVDTDKKADIENLHNDLSLILPSYAIPVFIRISNTIAKTGTFKFQKTLLKKQSFNPVECSKDLLFYYNGKERKYVTVDEDTYSDIQNQQIKF